MIFFVVAFALLAHVAWWGLGVAILTVPRPWRHFWPVLVFPGGFALQSAAVWLGAHAGLRGTNTYAWYSEVVPVGLLAIALNRYRWKSAWIDISRFGLVWVAVASSLVALCLPFAIASRGLTSLSLGSCDAADYAAGARVFMEFAHSDRTGFLGLTEVVRVMSADNFYDFWLRLNHFTPSALMALNGSILGCQPHELASVLTAVVLASAVPLVFWVARAIFGYTGAASLAIAALFGFSPIPWYSVAHVSPAPLLAAQAIALLNWAGFSLWNGRLGWRRVAGFSGVLAIGYALVLGSYNFILIVALVPSVTYAAVRAVQHQAWQRFARWLLGVLLPLIGCAIFFWGRVDGLVERFMLFQTYDFGWRIPLLTPEGWVGMVEGGTLEPWHFLGLHWLLALLIVVALGWGLIRTASLRPQKLWVWTCITVPVLTGYAFLEVRGVRLQTNASYDAFKLMTVFYPLLLPAFCWWLTLRWGSPIFRWAAVMALGALVAAANLVASAMFVFKLSRPPLIVDGELRQLRKVEAMPEVASVNVLLPDMWSRLWANEFLLRKPQYFSAHTYEGRLNTALRGDWDLDSDVLDVRVGGGHSRELSRHYRLIDTRSPNFVRASLGDGWYDAERLPDGDQWRWMQGQGALSVENPHPYPIRLTLIVDGRGLGDRTLTVGLAGRPASGAVHVGAERRQVELPSVEVPPGKSRLVLASAEAPATPAGDTRSLTVCVYQLIVKCTADR